MSGALKPYPKYKESGVEWLGAVPEGWEITRVGWLYMRMKLTGHPDEELLSVYRDYGVIPKSSRDDNFNKPSENLDPYQLVQPGDLVLNKMKTWQGAIGISRFRGIVSPAYIVCKKTAHPYSGGVNEPYFNYLVRIPLYAAWFASLSQGIRPNQWDLDFDDFKTVSVLLPPLPEQQAIADYLDAETQRIDTLIAELREMIRLLKEKRQALISHCVTKGLDPTVPMKDSGVEWLGEVPEGWEVVRVKHVIESIEQGWSPQCYPYPAGENEWGVLKVGCVNSGIFRPQENKALPEDLEPREWLSIKSGDVLVSRANTRALVGSTAVSSQDYPRLLLSDKVYRLRVNVRSMTPGFLGLQLRGPAARALIELNASGASDSMQNISQETIAAVRIAIPPLPDQHAIAAHLDRETAKIDRLISETEDTITLMQERRSVLISSVVTGKLRVPGLPKPSGSTLNSRPENS